jgi:hypothetical protein
MSFLFPKMVVVNNKRTYLLNGLQARRPEIDSRQDKVFVFFTASRPARAHSASYPLGTGDSFPGDKAAGA